MKRFLIRMSTLATIVVLGCIAIAQAQKGVNRPAAKPVASVGGDPARAEGSTPQPALFPATVAPPREFPAPSSTNPLRPGRPPESSPAVRASGFAGDIAAESAQASSIAAAEEVPLGLNGPADPPGLRRVADPFVRAGHSPESSASPEMNLPTAGQAPPALAAASDIAPAQPLPAQDTSFPTTEVPAAAPPAFSGPPTSPAVAAQSPGSPEPGPIQADAFAPANPMPATATAGPIQQFPTTNELQGPPAQLEASNPPTDGTATAAGTGTPGTAQLEGPQTPQVTVQKFAPQEIQVGKPAKFQVKVQNTGQVAAHNVEIRDEVPRGTQLISTTPPASRGVRGELVWPLGTLQPGEEMSVEIELMPVAEGEIGSVASVAFHAEASSRSIATKPELVVQTVAPRQVLIGEEVVLSITVANPGSGIATGVVIVERVPPGLQHAAGAELEYEIGELRPNESRQIELRMVATQAGRVTNELTARGAANLRADDRVEIEVLAPRLEVAVDGPKRRYLEREAVYNVSVSNPGTAPAHQVELVAHLPAGMKFVGANNSGYFDQATQSIHWVLEELPANETGTVQLTAIPTVAGEHAIRVSGTADRGLSDEHQQAILVEGIAAILFEVVDVEDPIEVNGETTYEIRVVNQGSKAATNVHLVAELPAGMKAVAAEGPTRNGVNGNQVRFEPLGRLAPKADTTYRIRVQGIQPGDQRIRVQLHTDELQPPITKEESTRVYADQ